MTRQRFPARRAPAALPALLLALCTLVALAGCMSLDSPGSGGPVVEAPVFRVGDRWVYRAQDGFRSPVRWEETREVVAIGADGIRVRVVQKGPTVDNSRMETWPAPGLVLVGAVFDNETRRFATPMKRFDYPLLPGKAWNQHIANFNEQTGKEGVFNRYVRVSGWTTVTTPAGMFDAIEMRVQARLDDEEFWRWPTESNYLVAYAPAVRGMVREEKEAQYLEKGSANDGVSVLRSQHAVLELLSFTPGAP